ncbi:MAG TPA: isoleucine--tRNA ligase [bacterium]|nr:isoleucine--tRNA ligase [bacterium]
MPFRPVDPRTDFPAQERATLEWWTREGILGRYLARNRNAAERWSFLDGPITANNPMGVHHAWGRTYKDLFCRYHTMLGRRQRYQNGFDCQGLWVEVEVEKELGFKSKRDIERYGIAEFVDRCKARVLKYAGVQTQQSIRLGYWMDWDNSYYTMSDENNYSIWLFLKRCWERGLVYKGHDVMPWCPRCSTGISEHEIVTEGYQEVTHLSLTVRLPIAGRPGEYLLVWTTTPWTLTSNVAVAVHPELTYVKVREERGPLPKGIYYVAQDRVEFVFAGQPKPKIIDAMPGSALVGWRYEGPFDDLPAQQGVTHRVVPWPEVSATEGTGLVHIAPGCGAEDFALGKELDLAVLAPIDEFGVFTEPFGWLAGRHVYDVAAPIREDLERRGLLYRADDHTHRYPMCWRCGSELVFRLVDEWFIAMDSLREPMMAVTRQIRWIPEFGLERELDWLRNMHDWMISKKRYWGLALPIYECRECGTFEVIGGEDELKARAVEGWDVFAGHTPHRPWIDAVKIRCRRCGTVVSRILDVGNPWLDAGIVPFSTMFYRQDPAAWRDWFPADFITEAFPGQYRNWFYSMLVMSTVLENRPPFLTCLGHAMVRDETGREMHKSWGNMIEFNDAAERMGADVIRWLYAVQNPAQNVNFGYGPGDEVRRRFILPLWNVYAFFVTYANLDGWAPAGAGQVPPAGRQIPPGGRQVPPGAGLLDRWILSRLADVTAIVRERLDAYDVGGAARPLERFVDDLSLWYVRRGRRRYWKSDADADKQAAYETLYGVLVALSKVLAPFLPFLAEALYQNLVRSLDAAAPESVHLCAMPGPDAGARDPGLEQAMQQTRHFVSLGRAARGDARLKVRQPLAFATLLDRSGSIAGRPELIELLRDELNVRDVRFAGSLAELGRLEVRPRFDLLGPKFGGRITAIADALRSQGPALVEQTPEGEPYRVRLAAGDEILLERAEVDVRMRWREAHAGAGEGGAWVVLDTTVTDDLAREGLARELIHQVQQMRKEAGLEIADRITLYYDDDDRLGDVLRAHGETIFREVLAVGAETGVPAGGVHRKSVRLDGHAVTLGIAREQDRAAAARITRPEATP